MVYLKAIVAQMSVCMARLHGVIRLLPWAYADTGFRRRRE